MMFWISMVWTLLGGSTGAYLGTEVRHAWRE